MLLFRAPAPWGCIYMPLAPPLLRPSSSLASHLQKAKKKPIAKLTAAELGVDISPRVEVMGVTDPPTREAGSKVADVDELLEKLKSKGVI